jgi:hypothetical protein
VAALPSPVDQHLAQFRHVAQRTADGLSTGDLVVK